MGEFDLIDHFFKQRFAPLSAACAQVRLGIGDDCALLQPSPGHTLCVSTDLMVEGRHFLSTVSPEALGHKLLAVNLSDLAACGAQPFAFTLSLCLPRVDAAWLDGFSRGLLALATAHNCPLVGGDTTAGPLCVGITVLGEVPSAPAALKRSGAQVGDDIYVSGFPGEARMALEAFRGNLSLPQSVFAAARARMERPTPRVALGQALRGVATACVDVSDGLCGDLGHILRASRVQAALDLQQITRDVVARAERPLWTIGQNDPAAALRLVLAGGDDYELVFTAPVAQRAAVAAAVVAAQTRLVGSTTAWDAPCPVTRIGQIEASSEETPSRGPIRWVNPPAGWDGAALHSFDHFA